MSKKPMNPVAKRIIIIVILAGAALWCLISGIMGLISSNPKNYEELFSEGYTKGDYFCGEIPYSSDCVLCMKHTLNFIPAAYEYFYAVPSEDFTSAVLVRAGKKFGENFKDGAAISDKVFKGRVKKVSEYETQKNLATVSAELEYEGVYMPVTYYVDLLSGRYYIFRIIIGVVILLLMITFGMFVKAGGTIKDFRNKARNAGSAVETYLVMGWVILLMGVLVLALHVMEMH